MEFHSVYVCVCEGGVVKDICTGPKYFALCYPAYFDVVKFSGNEMCNWYYSYLLIINTFFTFYSNLEEQTLPNKRQVMESKVKKRTAELERRHVLEGRKQLQDRPQSGNMEQQNENLELEHQQAQDRTLSQQKLLQVLFELYLYLIWDN